ncbi:exonuclease mut-7 homolog isoform X2 [Dysidea avara]|uniref:exonuclease mut-7 homolog isoform X2 n=1 Tax=Dysidea avara TaxID=196820 RepID=UPI00331C8E90
MIGLVLVIAYLLRLISGRARQGLGERPQDNDQDLSGYSSDDEESNQFPDLEDNEQQSTLYHQTPITKPVSQGGYSRGYHTYLETSAASKLEQTDGWLSDDETTTSISTAEIEQGTYRRLTLAAVTSADDSDLYEDFKALWAKNQKQLNPKLRTTLYSIFRQRPDVYAFLLHCARKSSTRQSITKLVLSEFLQYKKTVREKESIPQPQLEHQLEALQICTRSHPIIFHDMCSIFDLDSAPHSNKMQLIKTLLRTNGKHKEAVTYARKLNLQKCFHLEEMLLPLVVMDKINIIESYVSADQELQFQFVKILDNLCASGSDLDGLASSYERAGISVGESSKLTRRQLNKLASRLAKTYGLDIEKFPNVAFSRASGSLHYMLSKYYKEGGISSDNMEDLIKASVLDNVQLQINLLLELIRYKDLPAAAYWAQYFNIDSRNIPFQLQDYMKHHPTVKRHKWQNNDSTDHHNDEYYCLNISLDQVHFIDNQGDLQHCQQTLCQQGNVIGVDAEWRLSACNAGVERIALLQLATKHAVYLLDMIALTADVSEEILRGFTASVFSSTDTIKLGYGIAGDFRVIAHSWPFVAEIVGTPCQVIDLQIFARSVKVAVEAKSGTNKKDTPPSHKSTSPTNTQEDLTTPSQCTSLNEAIVMRTFQKLDSIPDTELPSVPVSGDDVVGDDESNTEHSASSGPRGLGLLVKECFGRPLDKSQQLSDWERRPLKREQVYYAALDAYCLLEVYKHLKEKALAISPDFNITPFLTSSTAGKAVYKFYKTDPNCTSGKVKLTPPVDNYTIVLLVLTLSTTQTTRNWFQQTYSGWCVELKRWFSAL